MKKILLILVGLILLGCSSVDETSTNTDYYPWYNDYYYGYYDSYYDNGVYWDDLSDEEKKEIIEDIKENPEFQEYVKDKLEDRFPDGIPEVEDRKRTKEDILNNREEFDRDLKERQRPPVSNDNLFLKERLKQPRTRNLKR
ncbi:hypothetical protein NRK67_02000 [Fusobacteria bacterium ZRK30]|nr:hypothetical protein NRK67_02000 [Fusobacteria bacterium ZRK30]